MASKEKRATYTSVVIDGKTYIRIKRRCGFRKSKSTGASVPYYKDFYGKTKKEAEAKYKSYRIEKCLDENGLPDLTAKRIERRTFRELFESWLDNVFMLDSKYAKSTKDNYSLAYNSNMKDNPIMDEYIVHLTGSDLQEVYNNMTCGASTIKSCHNLMRLFFKYQEMQGICLDITRGVKVIQEIPHKRTDQSVEVISADEIRNILQGFEKHRLYLLILLAARTGARISELLALQYSDITDEGIMINKQAADGGIITKTKTPASVRIVPISADTRALIQEHKQWHQEEMLQNGYRTDFIFTTRIGTVLDRHNVWRDCNRVYKNLGIKNIGFHVYRHSFASELANNGVPIQTVQKLLGHTSTAITSRYYINVSDEQKIAAIESLSV